MTTTVLTMMAWMMNSMRMKMARITAVANPLSEMGFLYFKTVVRPLTLDDDDVSLYIDHILFALQEFDIARML